jgi:hypothetical protein
VTSVVRSQLAGLARTVAELRERVRVAVAGELGRAVGGAVQQVVQAVVAGRTEPPYSGTAYGRSSSTRWDDDGREDRWDRPHDPWADDTDDEYDRDRHYTAPARGDAPSPPRAAVTAAVAAGVYAARWWLGRRGTWLAAAGLGLGVGLLGVLGGPVARTAVAALAAVADILGATDALGDGATRLDHR